MRAVALALPAASISGCTQVATVSTQASSPVAARPATVRVVAAGDIATCDGAHDTATGKLVRALAPRAVLTLADHAYDDGGRAAFACYDAAWSSFRGRTFPTPGNHDYATSGAAGYFEHFGSRAPAPYYSFNLGGWHLVSLNSEIEHGEGSEQVRWLRADPARRPAPLRAPLLAPASLVGRPPRLRSRPPTSSLRPPRRARLDRPRPQLPALPEAGCRGPAKRCARGEADRRRNRRSEPLSGRSVEPREAKKPLAILATPPT